MDSPPRESESSRKKKTKGSDDREGGRSKNSLKKSFKWLLGSKKKCRVVRSDDERDDVDDAPSGSTRSETVPDPDASGYDLFGPSPGGVGRLNDGESSSDLEPDVNPRSAQDGGARDTNSLSTPGRKRLAARAFDD